MAETTAIPTPHQAPKSAQNVSRLSQPRSCTSKQLSHPNALRLLHRATFLALILLRLASPEAHADITSNLRAHYPFTAGTGNDVSGNALHATLANVTVTPGPLGISPDAALFNGSNSTAVVSATIAMGNQQTFAAWIKPTAYGDYRPIIEKADPGYAGEIDCELRIKPDGKVDWYVSTVGGPYGVLVSITSNSSVTLNVWTHVAGVIDRANNQIRLYLNGNLEGTVSMGGSDARNNNRVLRIGNQNSNQAVRYFQGALDEVRIYDRALSNIEVQSLANENGAPSIPSESDFDKDRIPDSWEIQYGLDASIENFRVGSSVDGNLTVNAGQTSYPNDLLIGISTAQAAGSTSVTGSIPITVKIGDIFMLHAIQEGNPAIGAPAGTFELVQIASIGDGKVGVTSPLKYSYNPTTGGKIQCIYVPQYDNLQVNGTVAARPWNGTSGGIVAIIANDVTIASGGGIDASGKGFRSGAGFSVYGSFSGVIGVPGEGKIANSWPMPNSTLQNSSGGAGGNFGSVGGGGAVSSGIQFLEFGGGGGSGGVGPTRIASIYGPRFDWLFTSNAGSGGKGGGLLVIISRRLQNNGIITSAGASGEAGAASGGGGAGGSMFLISRTTGTGAVSAQQGDSGAYPSTTGAGAVGEIRLERGSFASSPIAFTTGDGYFDNQSYAALTKYNDPDGDGLDDYAEYLAGTNPLVADTDGDGVPDGWEVRFGTPPLTVDGNADPDQDGLTNLQEYRAGSHPNSVDGDNDGIPDTSEIGVYGTNPLLSDSDGDGMDDAWEIANELNPLLNDANEDRDLDGLTNLEEYALRSAGYKANAANSKAGQAGDDGLSDYARSKGEGWARRLYDKNDRLISTERDNGLVQIYTYDGNSQKIRDVTLTKVDADGDGLPDAWEWMHNLAYSGASAALGDNGPTGDPDHDGFSNFLEWKAGTDPRNAGSRPSMDTSPVTNPLIASSGFTPTNWVMATGQLDGSGADEVVVGSDGSIVALTNQFSIYQKTDASWVVSPPTSVGSIGINSLAIGESATGRGTAIYLGSRPPSGVAGIQEFRRAGTTWFKSTAPVAESTSSSIAQVVGVNSSGVLGLLSPAAQAADGMYRTTLASDTWSAPAVLSSSAGKRSWPIPVLSGQARWLDAGGIEINGGTPPASLGAIKNPATGNWYFLTPSPMTWVDAEITATQNGGHLVTVNDSAEQQWIQTNFPSQNMLIGLQRGLTGDGWQWISGENASYRNWYPGEPNNAGGSEPYGSITTSSGLWNDTNSVATYKGMIELPGSGTGYQTLSDPTATSKLIWRGHSLASGQLRKGTSSGTSLVYAFVDDKDTSSTVNSGDTFVLGEYELSTPSPILRTTMTLPISTSISSSAIGITILKRQNSSLPSVLAIGEPDGTVSLWTAPDAGSPLVRKIFTTDFKGKSWHQFEVFHEANGTEGLVGLLVDPATPAQCQLIHWSPESIEAALNGTAPVLNHVPLARILPTPSQGGSTGSVAVRIWDAEAHGSSLELQYQRDGETVWNNATVSTVDGGTFQSTLKLTSQAAGISHTLVWNAAANLGSTFSGTVLLRTRATDSQAGDWSPGMPYAVNTSINLDTDSDGMPDAWEASHGLASGNPADGTSDNDHDGVSAFLEYALAMNPTVMDVALLPILGTKTETDGKHLILTYHRPINSGLTYTAERSVTLIPGTWQSGNVVFQELTPLNLGDGTESVTVEDLNPMSASSRAWLRLRVSK